MRPATRRKLNRVLLYVGAILLAVWVLAPIYFIAVAAFSTPEAVRGYPKQLLPRDTSADTMTFFLQSHGVLRALWGSVTAALTTLVLAIGIGTPAGYALARFSFRGANTFRMLVVSTRAFPIVILSIPLAVTFIRWGIDDTYFGVALMHTALALPFTVLVTGSVFAGISEELEEAAMTLGCTRFQAFRKVALPLALPGLAAAAIFTWIVSWNEVFAASVLTVRNPTLTAHVLSAVGSAPVTFQFAGGFFLLAPALVVVFIIRKYLFNLWGRVVK
jgi:multiple sugar transport system permease protein